MNDEMLSQDMGSYYEATQKLMQQIFDEEKQKTVDYLKSSSAEASAILIGSVSPQGSSLFNATVAGTGV